AGDAVGVVWIGIVGQHIAADGGVFAGAGAVVAGDGNVVHFVHGDGKDRKSVVQGIAVDGVISEAVGAEEVRVWCVGVRSVGIRNECTAGWTGIEYGGECVFVAGDAVSVIWIGIVGQHIAANSGVFVGAGAVVAGDGNVIHFVHGDG